jgi:hypothetical protein
MNSKGRCPHFGPAKPYLRQCEVTKSDRRGSQSVVGERRDNESRGSAVNSRAPTEIVDGQESRWKGWMVNTVSERTVCNRPIVVPTV